MRKTDSLIKGHNFNTSYKKRSFNTGEKTKQKKNKERR